MGFKLIKDDTIYKQVISTTGGEYLNGVWLAGEEEVSYEEIFGIIEPYNKSQQSTSVPEGLANSEVFLLFSPDELKTHQSLSGDSHLADTLLLKDITDNPNTPPYTVWDKLPWEKNKGFNLIDDYYEYIIIREDRV